MSDYVVQNAPLGAIVSHSVVTQRSTPSKSTLHAFQHRTRYARPSAQQLHHIHLARQRWQRRSITREQQQGLAAALIAAADKIPKQDTVATQLQVNVFELVYSGLSPMTCDAYWAVLALVTGRSVEQVKNWFSNARLKRDKTGRSRVVQLAHPFFRKDDLKVYPDKARKVEEMTLERFVQLVEAERDRQTILLGADGSKRGNVAVQEKAGTQPTKYST
ncbi:hypothetical protein K523DRAFT_382384 [Schizophyllum commune Tattone D]|nr:hypothetical protein K523DRAFT_382384 [Schizophyllum commune Tattone D]